MNILFCGDIMPGGVLPYQDNYITPDLLNYLKCFDFRIGTLEAAIGTGLGYDPIKMADRMNIVYARNEDFFRVKEMGFDVVSIANNHVWDLGEEGLRNTISILKKNGIKYCGAGDNIEEASLPVVVEKNGITVAVYAYCMYGDPCMGYVELAKEKKAGVNPLDIKKVIADIKDAKQKYDKVIIMPHWGREHQFLPSKECIKMAKKMINAGADAVLGSHPHRIQPLVLYKGRPICYSMGNFLFPDLYLYPPRPIWYPESTDELKDIKDVIGYPFPVKEPIREVWNPIARYGSIISVSIENKKDKVKATCRYVHCSFDNVESLSTPNEEILKLLKKASLIITCIPYRFLSNTKQALTGMLKKILKKNGEQS